MKTAPFYTASQVLTLGVATTRTGIQALVDVGDLHPEGPGHARYPAAEVLALAGMAPMDLDQRAMLVRLASWTHEDSPVFAGRSGYGYKAGLTPGELADSCRGIWRIDPARFFRSGLLIPVHLGITRGAFRIVGSGPIPIEDRWAVEVEALEDSDRGLTARIVGRRVSLPGRNPVRFINGA